MEFLQSLHPALLGLVRVLLLLVPVLLLVPGAIWWERRLLSWMQDRIGPNRTGTITFGEKFPLGFLRGRKVSTFGLLQPIADGIKLFLKEDVTPANVDRRIYFIAPMIGLFPAFALGGTMPWGPTWVPNGDHGGLWSLLTPVADVDIGLLFMLAVSSLGAYGTVLSGYASNNKYSLMGGLRASAQLISYELAMGMALASVVLFTGSLRFTELIRTQEQPLWGAVPWVQNWFIFTPFGLVAGVIFLVTMVAETNRVPFDLPEAENELIAGYHTEYMSMKFAVFFMGEYAAMMIFGGIFACVFLGGYNFVPINWMALGDAWPAARVFTDSAAAYNYWLAPLGFLMKMAAGMTFFVWTRATLPRLRYDQLMRLGWKVMLPAAVANFIVVGLFILGESLSESMGYGAVGGWIAVAASAVILVVLYLNLAAGVKSSLAGFQDREAKLVDPNDRKSRRAIRMVDPSKPA